MSTHRTALRLTRRGFIAASGAVALGTMVGCGGGGLLASANGLPGAKVGKAYRFSTRNCDSASNAAKSHAANKLAVSPLFLEQNRAHPGDKSKIVCVDIKPATWQLYFGAGDPMVDLRHV